MKERLECYEPSNPIDWDDDNEFDELIDDSVTAVATIADGASAAGAEGEARPAAESMDDSSTVGAESAEGVGKKRKKDKKRESDGSIDTTISSKRNRAQQAAAGEGGETDESGPVGPKKPAAKVGGSAVKAAADKKEMMQMKGLIVRLKAKVKEESEARTALADKVKALEGKTIPLLNKEIANGTNKIDSQKEKIAELKKVRASTVFGYFGRCITSSHRPPALQRTYDGSPYLSSCYR